MCTDFEGRYAYYEIGGVRGTGDESGDLENRRYEALVKCRSTAHETACRVMGNRGAVLPSKDHSRNVKFVFNSSWKDVDGFRLRFGCLHAATTLFHVFNYQGEIHGASSVRYAPY